MNILMTSISFPPWPVPVPDTHTSVVAEASPKPEGVFCASVANPHKLTIPNNAENNTFNENFFICFFL